MDMWCKRVAAGCAGIVVALIFINLVALFIARLVVARAPGTGWHWTTLRFVFCLPRDPRADNEALDERDTSCDIDGLNTLGVPIPLAGLPALHYRHVAAGQDL